MTAASPTTADGGSAPTASGGDASTAGRFDPPHSPTATARGLAVLVWVIAVAILAWHTGFLAVTAVAAAGGGMLVIAGLAGARESVMVTAWGSLLFVGAAALLSAALGLAVLSIAGSIDSPTAPEQLRPVSYALGIYVAAAGLALVTREGEHRTVARSILTSGGVNSLVLGTIAVVAGIAVPLLAAVLSPLSGHLVGSTDSPRAVASWLLLVALAALATAALVDRLPVDLVARERRPAVRERVDRLYTRLLEVGVGALIVGALAFLVVPTLWDSLPSVATTALLALTTAWPLRILLIAVTVLAALLVAVVAGLRQLHPESAGRLVVLLAHGAGAIAIAVVLIVVGPGQLLSFVLEGLGESPAAETLAGVRADTSALAVLSGLTVGVVALLTILAAVATGLAAVGVLPPRTAGAVLAAGGTTGGVVAAGQHAGVSALLFVVVGLAVVLWDVTTYGQRLTIEQGHGRRRLELVHGGTVVLVALLGVVLSLALLRLTGFVTAQPSAGVALAALLSILLFVLVIRS